MGWIIIANTYAFVRFIPLSNELNIDELYESPLFSVIPGGFYGIDTFLFISGLLSSYVIASKMYK